MSSLLRYRPSDRLYFIGLTFIRPRHVFLLLLLVSVVLSALMLAGCSSSSGVMPNIYLMHMGYNGGIVYQTSGSSVVNSDISLTLGNIVGQSALELRIGYFAMCMRSSSSDSWLCNQNASTLAAQLSSSDDPLNLIHAADSFRSKIVFPYLLLIAAALSFIVFILILPFPPLLKSASTALCFLACILVLVSVLWQHTSSVAAGVLAVNVGNGTVFAGVGVTAMIMGWLSFGMLTVTVIGIYYFVVINQMVVTKIEG
ncbi:membrane fusion mating protein FIG1 [Myxozyma melibiosi]|uniref:Membrane fusion mating protein FIG1 n=1 Tax=Myxozyma melibiosi TaxID=54550 RepID=A0ABR1EZG2_9ASCO